MAGPRYSHQIFPIGGWNTMTNTLPMREYCSFKIYIYGQKYLWFFENSLCTTHFYERPILVPVFSNRNLNRILLYEKGEKQR